MPEIKPRDQAEPKTRVRYLHSVIRDGIEFPAGSFEEDLSEQAADALVAAGRAKKLRAGDLPGDLPTEGADHTTASPPGTVPVPVEVIPSEPVKPSKATKQAEEAAAPSAKTNSESNSK